MAEDPVKSTAHVRKFRYTLGNTYGEGVHESSGISAAGSKCNYSETYHSVITHTHVQRYEYRYEGVPFLAHTYC